MKRTAAVVKRGVILGIVLMLGIFIFEIIENKNSEDTLSETPITQAPIITIKPTASPMPTQVIEYVYDDKFAQVDVMIQEDIENGFPGAVLLIAKDGRIVFNKAYGYAKIMSSDSINITPTRMQEATLFDVASLTKIYATTLAIMKLLDDRIINLDDYVKYYIPSFETEPYNEIKIKHLLNHTSGYPSHVKFYWPDVEEGPLFYSISREYTLALLTKIPLENAVGSLYQYSDIGYIALCALIEAAGNVQLDEYVQENIYKPLNIQNGIMYTPLKHNFDKNNVAATEINGNTRSNTIYYKNIRTHTLQGEVHDEIAYYSMGEVSGHAGLFANAYSINIINQMLLTYGSYDNKQIYSQKTIENVITGITDRPYGFKNASNSKTLSKFTNSKTFYHSGWTGTFSLIDYDKNLSIVLLTNKRHTVIKDEEFLGDDYMTSRYFGIIAEIYKQYS